MTRRAKYLPLLLSTRFILFKTFIGVYAALQRQNITVCPSTGAVAILNAARICRGILGEPGIL
ncbi:hypothetical protein [Rhizobium grahamii]|uniref:hypothetical protein n=1 Tax=Rhizobium grahamii TaxID=1120045 RepID=UPI001146B15A|nr:hypothetical protein [Rhizobium grahamii]